MRSVQIAMLQPVTGGHAFHDGEESWKVCLLEDFYLRDDVLFMTAGEISAIQATFSPFRGSWTEVFRGPLRLVATRATKVRGVEAKSHP